MINKISAVCNYSYASHPAFKGADGMAKPEDGVSYSAVSTANALTIPELAPIEIPSDLNSVRGERVYSSDGKLLEIKENNDKHSLSYEINDDKITHVQILDKTNGIIAEQQNFNDGSISVKSKQPDGLEYETIYANGEVCEKSKSKSKHGHEIMVSYDSSVKEYIMTESGNKKDDMFKIATFDENKQCKGIYEDIKGASKNISFYNGVPYSVDVMVTKPIKNNIKVENMDMTNLEPATLYTVNYDKLNEMNGEKTYYSNGNLEKIITEDGTIYNFDTNGKVKEILSTDKEIYNKENKQFIIEKFDDNTVKTTTYNSDNVVVELENDTSEKMVTYYPNERVATYRAVDKNNNTLSGYNFDENGMLTKVWDIQE